MWIKKPKLDALKAENKRLNEVENEYRYFMNAIERASDGYVSVRKDTVIFSRQAFDLITEKQSQMEDTIQHLTAEKDWYKLRYAELAVRDKDGGKYEK